MLVLILILPHYLINDTIFFFKLKPTQCLFWFLFCPIIS
jgi:hypothetical protein